MIWYDMIWYDMIWYDMIWYDMIWYDMIWYLTAIGLTPSGSSTFTHKQYIEHHNQHKQYTEQFNSLIRKSANSAPFLWGIPWHLPYDWGKITEKPHSIRIHKHNYKDKMFRKTEWEGENSFDVAELRDKWRALVTLRRIPWLADGLSFYHKLPCPIKSNI
jgi:hypothetical protein